MNPGNNNGGSIYRGNGNNTNQYNQNPNNMNNPNGYNPNGYNPNGYNPNTNNPNVNNTGNAYGNNPNGYNPNGYNPNVNNPNNAYGNNPNGYNPNGYNPNANNPNRNNMSNADIVNSFFGIKPDSPPPTGAFVDGKFVDDYEWDRIPKDQPRAKNIDPEATIKMGLIFLFIGVISLLIGVLYGKTTSKYKTECTGLTEGVIVEVVSSNKKGYDTRRTMYTPYVEYTVKSQTYTHKVRNPARKGMFHVGDKMMVHYDPSDPENCYVDRERVGLNIGSKGMIIIGSLIIIGAIFLFALAYRDRQREYRRYGV